MSWPLSYILVLRDPFGCNKKLTLTVVIYSQHFKNRAIVYCKTPNEYFQYLFALWDCSRTKFTGIGQSHLQYMYATGPRRPYSTRSSASTGPSFRPSWPAERIVVIDDDQGKSASSAKTRPGFARLIAAVAQSQVGIVIALEVTRLSRNSPDWHHLLYLCRFTGTLIADEHTIYDPDHATDRLVLGIRCLDDSGVEQTRHVRVERDQWRVVIHDHHDAYISWQHFVNNQEQLRGNQNMRGTDQPGPAREGLALLQGLVVCGHCGRRMGLSYGGSTRARVYQYRCSQARQQQGGRDCQVVGGKRIDQAVVAVFVEAMSPCAADAAQLANQEAHREGEALRTYWAQQIERVAYQAQRAERQYMATEPENRVVARELERRWELALNDLERVRNKAALVADAPELLSADDLEKVHLLGLDMDSVWNADSTTNRDRKRLLRCLIEEVQLSTNEDHYSVRVVWKGGAMTERERVRLSRTQPPGPESGSTWRCAASSNQIESGGWPGYPVGRRS